MSGSESEAGVGCDQKCPTVATKRVGMPPLTIIKCLGNHQENMEAKSESIPTSPQPLISYP